MHKIILGHRHPIIQNDLFNLSKINWIHLVISPEFLHELGHIECAISRIDIRLDDLADHWKLGIERQNRIRRVAAETSAVSENLINLLINRKFR